LTVEFGKRSLSITIKISDSSDFLLDFDLCAEIEVKESSYELLSTKIEFVLKKSEPGKWNTLQNVGEGTKQWSSVSAPPKKAEKKNWDKIVEEETKDDKLGSDESLNKVFQDIFSNGSDEQKKAMMKSFTESGGTVLSTNWDEVGKKKVDPTPPEGMVAKKWEQ